MTWPFGNLKPHHYRVIVLDPPTKFVGGTKGRPQHYRRMTQEQLAEMPLEELAHPDGCWVFCWITSPHFRNVHRWNEGWTDRRGVRHQGWGAKYSGRAFVWIKTKRLHSRLSTVPLFMHRDGFHKGMGYTTRKNAEDVLLFKYGTPKRLSKKVQEPIFAPVREHSRKPKDALDRIVEYADGPRCELFSRETDPRFEVWGDQAGLFDEAA